MTSSMFADLTRAELDEWLTAARTAEGLAYEALIAAPLTEPGVVQRAAGVAVDMRAWYMELAAESLGRFIDGEQIDG